MVKDHAGDRGAYYAIVVFYSIDEPLLRVSFGFQAQENSLLTVV